MQSSLNISAEKLGKIPNIEPPKFSKRIGSTNYIVAVYSSQTSAETIEDKLLRLIKSEVRSSA
jgi:hypothetical protein